MAKKDDFDIMASLAQGMSGAPERNYVIDDVSDVAKRIKEAEARGTVNKYAGSGEEAYSGDPFNISGIVSDKAPSEEEQLMENYSMPIPSAPTKAPIVKDINATSPASPQRSPASTEWDWGDILVGATPALLGLLMDEPAVGFNAGGQGLIKRYDEKASRYDKALAAKAKSDAASKNKPLTKSNVILTRGESGAPIISRIEDSVGKEAYEKRNAALNFDERARLEKLKARLKEKSDKGSFKNERDLRADYNKDQTTKDTKSRTSSYNVIKKLSEAPQTGANDLSMIFAYMKMLDPGSVVREGEQATARNAGAVPDNIRNLYNRMIGGEDVLLPKQVRQNFATEAQRLYDSQLDLQKQVDSQYSQIASRYGIDSSGVLIMPSVQSPAVSIPEGKVMGEINGKKGLIPKDKVEDFKRRGGRIINGG